MSKKLYNEIDMEKKPVDVQKNNRRTATQFRKLLEKYNPVFARVVYDKHNYAYIMQIVQIPTFRRDLEYENMYEAMLFSTMPNGEERLRNLIGEADLYTTTNTKDLHIDSIEVKDVFQDNGLGQQMLKQIESFAIRQGMASMSLLCARRCMDHKQTGKKINVNYYIYSKMGFVNPQQQDPLRFMLSMEKDLRGVSLSKEEQEIDKKTIDERVNDIKITPEDFAEKEASL